MKKREIQTVAAELQGLKAAAGKYFVGQSELVDGVLAALFSGGHVLIEGVPGLGKTLLVRTLSRLLECQFARIQFTPDLMPSDITGSHIYHQVERKFVFKRGPLFTNLLLADEINRAPAKTHSALLEIMQESQVTIDNRKYEIKPPFLVMATQNPVESEGTYALPEAQLDRFLLKLLIDYPTEEEEREILRLHVEDEQFDLLDEATPLLSVARVLEIIEVASSVTVSPEIVRYITALVRETRRRRDIYLGGSPRAGIALMKTARVGALIEGRDFLLPDDVKRMAPAALRHRIMLTPEAEVEGRSADMLIQEVLDSVEVPRGAGGA